METPPNSPKQNIPDRNEDAIDVKWYGSFVENGSFQAYEYLNEGESSMRDKKEKFFKDGINPKLDYPDIDLVELEKKEAGLLKLKEGEEGVEISEENEVVKLAYRWKINEKIAELRMLKAVKNGNMRRFQKYSEFIYGKPSADIFLYNLTEIRKDLEPAFTSENPEIKEAAEKLYQLLPAIMSDQQGEVLLPEDYVVQAVREDTADLMKSLNPEFKKKKKNENFTAEEIKEVFIQALAYAQIEGWEVVIDKSSSKTGISVDHELKQVKIPATRKVNSTKLQALIVHEIGTHVLRRQNGERSKLLLLGLGLDRYEKGEEGIATVRGQTFKKKVNEFSGFDGHFAVSLAYGLDGKKRDFKEVYEILETYYYLTGLMNGEEKQEAKNDAKKNAWERCVRTFRGSNCETAGVCFTKDIIYQQGNIGTWQIINDNQKEMIRFNVGKYDPNNDRHVWILTQLGISDADLKVLEKE